jgi:hypothetical protein
MRRHLWVMLRSQRGGYCAQPPRFCLDGARLAPLQVGALSTRGVLRVGVVDSFEGSFVAVWSVQNHCRDLRHGYDQHHSGGIMDLSSLLKRYVTGLWPWAPKRPLLSQVHSGKLGIVRASTLASEISC